MPNIEFDIVASLEDSEVYSVNDYAFDIIASLEDSELYSVNDYAFDVIASLEGTQNKLSRTLSYRTEKGGDTWPITDTPTNFYTAYGPKKRYTPSSTHDYILARGYQAFDCSDISIVPDRAVLEVSLTDRSPLFGSIRISKNIAIYKIPPYTFKDGPFWVDLATCTFISDFWTIQPPSSTAINYTYYIDLPLDELILSDMNYFAVVLMDETTQPTNYTDTQAELIGGILYLILKYKV